MNFLQKILKREEYRAIREYDEKERVAAHNQLMSELSLLENPEFRFDNIKILLDYENSPEYKLIELKRKYLRLVKRICIFNNIPIENKDTVGNINSKLSKIYSKLNVPGNTTLKKYVELLSEINNSI